jgi:hypothetical protein
MKRDDKIEMLTIHTNGYISEKEMNEIVEQCKKDYHPYHTEVIIIIY